MPLGSHIERKRIGLWTPPIYDSYLFASKWHRALSHWYELQLHVIIAFNHFSLVAFGHRTNTDPWQHWKKNVCLKCLSAVVRTCFYLCRLALPLILLNEKFEIKSNKSNFVVWWSVVLSVAPWHHHLSIACCLARNFPGLDFSTQQIQNHLRFLCGNAKYTTLNLIFDFYCLFIQLLLVCNAQHTDPSKLLSLSLWITLRSVLCVFVRAVFCR